MRKKLCHRIGIRLIALGVWATGGTAGWGAPPSRAQQELNQIQHLEVIQDSSALFEVAIQGSAPPNFSTFELKKLARLVVDIEGARFGEISRELLYDDGPIRRVALSSHGEGERSIARVVVEFDAIAEVELDVHGSVLVIHPLERAVSFPQDLLAVRTRLAAEAERARQAAEAERQRMEEEARARAEAERLREEAEARAKAAEAERARQAAEAERQRMEEEARARAEAERLREEAEARAKAEAAEARAKAEAAERLRQAAEAERQRMEEEARARAEAERLREEAEARAKAAEAERARQAAEAERQRMEEEARARAEAERLREEAEARAKAEAAERARQAAEAERLRMEEEARARALTQQRAAERRASEERTRLAQKQAAARLAAEARYREEADRRQARQAKFQAPQVRHRPITAPPLQATPIRTTVERIGFRLLPDVARLTVRLNQQAVYTAGEQTPGVVTVILKQTRLGSANNHFPLETSYFGTAVQRIVPSERGGDVYLELHFDRPVSYHIRQQTQELQIDIER